jgi:hypothetical protein
MLSRGAAQQQRPSRARGSGCRQRECQWAGAKGLGSLQDAPHAPRRARTAGTGPAAAPFRSSTRPRDSAAAAGAKGPVVVIDNYDSFTYNLCQVRRGTVKGLHDLGGAAAARARAAPRRTRAPAPPRRACAPRARGCAPAARRGVEPAASARRSRPHARPLLARTPQAPRGPRLRAPQHPTPTHALTSHPTVPWRPGRRVCGVQERREDGRGDPRHEPRGRAGVAGAGCAAAQGSGARQLCGCARGRGRRLRQEPAVGAGSGRRRRVRSSGRPLPLAPAGRAATLCPRRLEPSTPPLPPSYTLQASPPTRASRCRR